jgi:hypothetical protein
MADAATDMSEIARFGRRTAGMVALSVGQLYALFLMARVAWAGLLTPYFAILTEIFVAGIALTAAVLFGWLAKRAPARWLSYAALGVGSVLVGRIVSAFIFMLGIGAIALAKAPGGFGGFLNVLLPSTLGFAAMTAFFTLLVPEALGLASGLVVLNILRGRFPALGDRAV